MPVMQPPTGPIEISDPKNVPETFVSGPFNIMNVGGMVHLTFTTARPNPNDLFKGSTDARVSGNSGMPPLDANGNGPAVDPHSCRHSYQSRPANSHEAGDRHQTNRQIR